MVASRIVAASSIFALCFAAPISRSQVERRGKSFAGYKVYGGDGTVAQGWPAESDWWSFEDLWAANLDTLAISCTQYPGSPPNNSPQEIQDIKNAILDGSKKTGVPSQYILAAVMQESKGCVRAPTTNYGESNPGLLQSFNGQASCNNGNGFTTPCPSQTINAMILEGLGIGPAFGIQQALAQSGASGVDKYYKAARIYNSGSIAQGGNLGAGIATHCYATDMANRLLGWTTQASSCNEGTIGSIGGSAPGGHNNGSKPPPSNNNNNNNNNNQAPPSPGGESSPTVPKAPGAAANCKSWYSVKKGDSCTSTGIPFDKLRSLNSGLDANCSNLWAGMAYCIAA